MLDQEVFAAFHALRDDVVGEGVRLDAYPLRWLDVALWMHAPKAQQAL
jgi:hypothetical protein